MLSKYKFFMDIEKEEKWLNEMAQKGYVFKSKSLLGKYRFSKAAEEAHIRLDFRVFDRKGDFQEYKTLFEDSGWRHVQGSKSSGTQYFVRDREDASEDIFSDQDSKAGRYKRHSEVWGLTTIFSSAFVVLFSGFNVEAMLNPRALYYTPGLWEMTGVRFWVALLFETPFALLRGYSGLIMFVLVLISLYLTSHSYQRYRNLVRN